MINQCNICGKFIDRLFWDEYVYKKEISTGYSNKTVYFCGWNCMRKWEKEQERVRNERRRIKGYNRSSC